jgi:hypothetical protein
MSFRQAAGPAGAANGTSVTVVGVVSANNGQYFLTTSDGTKYLITGKDTLQSFVGTKVEVTGTLQTSTTGISQIVVSSISINGGATGIFSTTKGVVWVTTGVVAAGTVIGVVVHEETKSSPSP